MSQCQSFGAFFNNWGFCPNTTENHSFPPSSVVPEGIWCMYTCIYFFPQIPCHHFACRKHLPNFLASFLNLFIKINSLEVFQQSVQALCKAQLAHGTENCVEKRENLCCFGGINSLCLYTCVITSIQKGCLILIWQHPFCTEICCAQNSGDSPSYILLLFCFLFSGF